MVIFFKLKMNNALHNAKTIMQNAKTGKMQKRAWYLVNGEGGFCWMAFVMKRWERGCKL